MNDLLLFPHGMDGFHVWEAGIVLARFVTKFADMFKHKKVLELGTGCGTVGVGKSRELFKRSQFLSIRKPKGWNFLITETMFYKMRLKI